jgi:protein gp37
MIFVNSMSDLFHEQVPDWFIDEVFAVMATAEQHTFQILTKRPDRMRDYLVAASEPDRRWQIALRAAQRFEDGDAAADWTYARPWPLPNVWLGVSVCLRHFVGRVDLLRETPAAVRFVSAEPLLGPLVDGVAGGAPREPQSGQDLSQVGTGLAAATAAEPGRVHRQAGARPPLGLTGIDWLIVGGESGPKHRPIDPQWVRDLRDVTRCSVCCGSGLACPVCDGAGDNGTAFFFKQWGGPRPGGEALLDGREWREFPQAQAVSA